MGTRGTGDRESCCICPLISIYAFLPPVPRVLILFLSNRGVTLAPLKRGGSTASLLICRPLARASEFRSLALAISPKNRSRFRLRLRLRRDKRQHIDKLAFITFFRGVGERPHHKI